ncbi:MAG TPA: hypothetical protein VL098_06055 [Flavipsychrobacter sp.]|nr:hypothetical protein [Flavipsychrobacter sp.]
MNPKRPTIRLSLLIGHLKQMTGIFPPIAQTVQEEVKCTDITLNISVH